jgi:ankyrin repeat protein
MKPIVFLLVLGIPVAGAPRTAAEMLFGALLTGDMKTMENLLANGLSPDVPDRFGRTPLGLAINANQARAVELLLASHADPNGFLSNRDSSGEMPLTPLQLAAQTGNMRFATMLISAGARVDATGASRRTALHFAVYHLDMMRFLLQAGADVNARDAQGASPLDEAAWNGSLDAAALLLAHGARLNEPDTQTGATPLNEAAYRGRAEIVQYLLMLRADPEVPDKRGYTALENAIRMGKEDAALALLKASPEGKQFPAAFETAIRKDEARVTEALLLRGSLPNELLPSRSTPLEAAASAGAVGALGAILNHDADPNLIGPNGATPLENAALKGYEAVVAALLARGAEVNVVNPTSGGTALYAAASFGKSDVVKMLLDRGADPTVCGKSRKSPYQAAVANGFAEAATLLQDRGRVCKGN